MNNGAGHSYQQFQPNPYQQFQPNPGTAVSDEQRIQAENYWGAHANSSSSGGHPNAAPWGGPAVSNHPQQKYYPDHHAPNYLQHTPAEKPGKFQHSVLKKFSTWGSKAESTATNVWHNLKTGSSITETAWGKVNLTAKAMTEGGFDALYKQTFTTFPHEKLKKSFACHLSTSTGPLAGTLYLSNLHVAFCSDSPLSFKAPSGQETWSYYKVMVPLGKVVAVNPVTKKENTADKFIQIATVDGHDFWFMGFVNHDKASNHLLQSISCCAASGLPVQ